MKHVCDKTLQKTNKKSQSEEGFLSEKCPTAGLMPDHTGHHVEFDSLLPVWTIPYQCVQPLLSTWLLRHLQLAAVHHSVTMHASAVFANTDVVKVC